MATLIANLEQIANLKMNSMGEIKVVSKVISPSSYKRIMLLFEKNSFFIDIKIP